MKNLFFVSIVFLVIACSKDDTNSTDVSECTSTSNCKLKSYKPPLSIDEASSTISYNPDGTVKQIITIDEGDLGLDTVVFDHKYFSNYFIRTFTRYNQTDQDTFYFDNSGKIIKHGESGSYTIYTYDNLNQITKTESFFASGQMYDSSENVWENGKITKIIGQGLSSTIEYYDEIGYHPIYNFQEEGGIYNFGVKVKHLVKKIDGLQLFGDILTIEIKDYIKDDQCNVIQAASKWTVFGLQQPYVVEKFKWECK